MTTHPVHPPSGSPTVGQPWKRAYVGLLKFMFLLSLLVPLGLTLYAAITLTCGQIGWGYPVAAVVCASVANLGTTAGYHRMLTHQAFQAHPGVQYALLLLGAIAGMGSPVTWAHDHLHHHSQSDTPHDLHSPHTPRFQERRFAGFWQWWDAHVGWLFRNHRVLVSAKARQVTSTPAAQFLHWTWPAWLLAGLMVPLCFGWNAFVWVGAVRLFLNHHITWSVNSICHLWGQQPFPQTKDQSKNNPIVGLLALGEGWHNNHHFRPNSARHGLLPGQLDLTYAFICLLERCKLVTEVKRYAPCPACQQWHTLGSGGKVCCANCPPDA